MNEPRDRPFPLNFRPQEYADLAWERFGPAILPRRYALLLWANIWLEAQAQGQPIMAKPQPRNRGNFVATTFVNFKLNDEQAEQYRAWVADKKLDIPLEISLLMTEHGKLSVSWDDSNACFIAAVTSKDEKSPNCDHCVSSRSDDWYEAVTLTVFKVSVLLKDTAWSSVSQGNNWG